MTPTPSSPNDDSTLDLACELIRRASVTPEDAGCQALMMERLKALGFHCTPLPFGDTENFWAQWGSSGPLLAFAGHTDVVPPGPLEKWDSDPFTPSLRDGMLYGRGAADMKGSLAAMITACESFLRTCEAAGNTPRGRIGFLITSDEEGPATHGTVRVMEWLAEQKISIDYCVVGEPSSADVLGDTIKNGRRGSLNAAVKILGRQGHVAYPQHADNPLHRALPALQALATRQWDMGNEYFPATSFQITNVHSGTGVTNVIPGHADVLINFRFSTEQTAERLQEAVEQTFAEHEVHAEIQWTLSGKPFITAEGALTDACREAVKDVADLATTLSTSGGTSDGRFIAPYGAQLVELGPVNASIHRVNEHVKADDLARLSKMYEGILTRLLNAP
ncbi:succinyl-diaminopimelate desuccinylase [Congregibacter litoralis]|uniref:Succinyl-diaminopimelate desuccinylase n=1 Tax=Congregibacter litoralis KT71 TaxID=314285 RepID=A4ACI8_9GAMM|nr:succinyl-diaminopimelate desuccinylase [Congregibacter litoralis]EAQ96202.1 succinyldiaminopimelate desuccinylase [Congregibacter litoralis KT71]